MSHWNGRQWVNDEDVSMTSPSPPLSPRRGAPAFNRSSINAGHSFSFEGVPIAHAEHAARLPYQPYGGNNDCGLRSLAGGQGTDPSDVLMRAHHGNTDAVRGQWDHHERHQMSGAQYRQLAEASGHSVTGEYALNRARLPQRGQSATVVEDGHAVVMARSESGDRVAILDYQQRTHRVASVNRVPDDQADPVRQHVYLHGNRRPSQGR
jgi:hypothetical protein